MYNVSWREKASLSSCQVDSSVSKTIAAKIIISLYVMVLKAHFLISIHRGTIV